MNGERLAELLNEVSRGRILYAYDEQSNRIMSISKDGFGEIMSTEKAKNELKLMSCAMLIILKEIFTEIVEDKPASNGGKADVQGYKRMD